MNVTSSPDRASTADRSPTRLGMFLAAQLLIGGSFVWAALWAAAVPTRPELPEFRDEPITIRPLYDEPSMISDAELERVLWKLRPRLRAPQEKINHIDHALRMWGPTAEFDDPECLAGWEMLETLLDHRRFQASQGDAAAPLLIATADGLSVRTQDGTASASHVDHTLAGLGEIGIPLDYPVLTATGEAEVRDLLRHALQDFRLNQIEYEWSTLAFAEYLEPTRGWISREGQEITFDRLANRLMRQRLKQGVCRGQHRLHTLVMLLRIDDVEPRLSAAARREILAYLQDVTQRFVAAQHSDGYWEQDWPGVEWDGPPAKNEPASFGVLADRLLVTGHALEWWSLAPQELLPPLETRERAARWLVRTVDGLSPSEVTANYTFLTHVGRALAMWRGKLPAEVIDAAPRL